jgi:urease accessory protein UreH
VIIARYLGDSMEVAHAGLCELWMSLRPALTGRAATRPRIWST